MNEDPPGDNFSSEAANNQNGIVNQEEIQWIRERYAALFDGSSYCVYVLDLDGCLIDANPAALTLLGYTRADLPSQKPFSLICPEQVPMAKQRIQQVLEHGSTASTAEYRLTAKDGRTVFLETKSSAILHDGRAVAIVGIGQDITDRKRAEDALRESESKFRGLAENMHAAVGIVHGQNFVYANAYMAHMLGYSIEEILSVPFPLMVDPSDRERLIDLARRRQSGDTVPTHYEFRALTKKGKTLWIDFSVGSMIYEGKPAIIGTGIDITARKEAEERVKSYTLGLKHLADSATRLLSTSSPAESLGKIFDQLADLLGIRIYLNYLITEDGTRLRLHKYRGLQPAVVKPIELISFGQTLCGTVAEAQQPSVIEDIQSSTDPAVTPLRALGVTAYACHPLLGHKGIIGTLALCAEDRSKFSADELELMRVTSHQAAMALEHQQLSNDIEQRAAQLAEANSAKDHFLAVLSHELRTPLTPVVLSLSMLQDKKELDQKTRETLEIIRSNVEMEAQLIDDLLDVTRIARGKIELNRNLIDLSSVIQRAVDVCRPDIDARMLSFGVDMGHGAPYVLEADPTRLQQVFWNLLKNSIKFTPKGGCVGIRCRPDDKHVVVEVNDSGIGIELESLPRIFDAFEQAGRSTTQQFGGLGLGLAISKALVEMHGGEISAESKGRDKGATFRIRLPLCEPVDQTRIIEISTQPSTRPLHILLVEDHGITAQMIRLVLEDKGHSVEAAGDIGAALELAGKGSFDLLVSDLGLPDGSGYDLMRELRKRGCSFPAIALSGYGQENDVRRSHEAGFGAHLTKPASRRAIYETVALVTASSNAPVINTPDTAESVTPVFDSDKALERCYGQRKMLEQMISFFPEESASLLGQIRTALQGGDLAEVGRAAHRLRGSLAYLGAEPASNCAIRLEQAVKSNDLSEASKAISELEHQVELLRNALASRQPPN